MKNLTAVYFHVGNLRISSLLKAKLTLTRWFIMFPKHCADLFHNPFSHTCWMSDGQDFVLFLANCFSQHWIWFGSKEKLESGSKSAEAKINTDPTIQEILTLAHTHLCEELVHSLLFEVRYLQTRKSLFVFPGICKHPQQKQVPPEWEKRNSHHQGSCTLTPLLPLMSFRELIMKAPYILILLIGEWM